MRELTISEIKYFAHILDFDLIEAVCICDIFYSEKMKGNYRLRGTKLSNVTHYIDEWEMNWYRYYSWDSLVESELDQGPYGLTESECVDSIGSAIFRVTENLYIQSVM